MAFFVYSKSFDFHRYIRNCVQRARHITLTDSIKNLDVSLEGSAAIQTAFRRMISVKMTDFFPDILFGTQQSISEN